MVGTRAYYGSFQAYKKGEHYYNQGQVIRAVTFFDRSLHWYTPFNPFMEKSATRLWEIGEKANREGDIKLALIAFRTIKRGFYASRSIYQPGKNWIKRCDLRINKLLQLEKIGSEHPESPADHYLSISKKGGDANPNVLWTLILEVGFLGWICSVTGLIISFSKDKRKKNSSINRAILFLGFAILFFCLWVLGMILA